MVPPGGDRCRATESRGELAQWGCWAGRQRGAPGEGRSGRGQLIAGLAWLEGEQGQEPGKTRLTSAALTGHLGLILMFLISQPLRWGASPHVLLSTPHQPWLGDATCHFLLPEGLVPPLPSWRATLAPGEPCSPAAAVDLTWSGQLGTQAQLRAVLRWRGRRGCRSSTLQQMGH